MTSGLIGMKFASTLVTLMPISACGVFWIYSLQGFGWHLLSPTALVYLVSVSVSPGMLLLVAVNLSQRTQNHDHCDVMLFGISVGGT